MLITHRIALDPTNKQKTLFRQHAGYARFVWNWGVAECRRALDAGEPGATRHERFRPLFNAKQAGTKCALRPPQFKSRKRAKASFRADNGPGTVRCQGKPVRLPRIGRVRTREACRFAGPVRECTVKLDGVRWHATVVCEVPDVERKDQGDVVGVDVGLRRLATVHDGESLEVIENPRPLKAALRKLRRINRRIARSRKVHGDKRSSNRRERMYDERRRLYVRVSYLRLDAAHKATTKVAKRSRLVCVESLNVSGWMRNRRLSRSTADASPSRFLSLLAWKCRREGVRPVEVGRFYPSSKTCSECGVVSGVLGMEAHWCCPACGVRHNRDDNASMNLRRQGLAADAEGMSDGREAAVPAEASTRQLSPHYVGLA